MAKTNKQQVSPISIFQHAETFISSLDQLHTASPDRVAKFAAPLMVLSAFAAELYFKCLICLEGDKVPKGHHLHNLYSHLSGRHKDILQTYWSSIIRDREELLKHIDRQEGRALPRDLGSALLDGNNTFVQIRYIYEKPPDRFRFNLIDLPIALRRTILEAEPTWGQPDPYPIGRDAHAVVPDALKEGSITFWVKHPEENWSTNNKYYSLGHIRQNNKDIIIFKTDDMRISITISGPLGRTFMFNVPVPATDPRGLFVAITWTIERVILYLNGHLVEVIDPKVP